MTLNQFQKEARCRGNFYDNTEAAMAYWHTCWGLGVHDLLWCYKEYTVGNLTYKTGNVVLRHGKRRQTAYYINGESVSKYRFMKALDVFVLPTLSEKEEKYINVCKARMENEDRKKNVSRRKKGNNKSQLVFDFDVA